MNEFTVGSKIDHERYGAGIISKVNLADYEIVFDRAGKIQISKSSDELTLLEEAEADPSNGSGLSLEEVEKVMTYVLDKYGALSEEVPLGDKWMGGTMILQPEDPSLKPKEVPIEAFFHKIVMVRDRLRVLEQSINSHKVLTDEEKVHLQQYITRVYGSLTTFNALFGDREHYFSGEKSK